MITAFLSMIDDWRYRRGYCDVCGSYLVCPVTGYAEICHGSLTWLGVMVEVSVLAQRRMQ